MSHLDLDRYYTPPSVARQLAELCESTNAEKCLDTACGDGSLLSAAREVHLGVQCIGMDLDRATVERLRRREPNWILSQADALSPLSWRRSAAARLCVGSDIALLNPPFTMATGKGIAVELPGFSGRCSVAMAHILAALGRAAPMSCSAIVPESLMFSELDARARASLAERYDLRIVSGLRNSTFRGTRANALIVRLVKREDRLRAKASLSHASTRSVSLVRGGLPLFEAKASRRGVRYLHSTELREIAQGAELTILRRVRPIARGIVSGHVMLLPRVGIPHAESLKALRLRERVQLSDCVLALCFESRAVAFKWERFLARRRTQLLALYRGTGARYTTVRRLQEWLGHVERDLAKVSAP